MKLKYLLCILIGIIFGWLFPVEGPIDYVYDDYASQPAHKKPVIVAPKQDEQVDKNLLDVLDAQYEKDKEKYLKPTIEWDDI